MSSELHAEFTAASRDFTNAESRPQGVTPSPVALPIFIASIAFITLAFSILRLRAIRYSSRSWLRRNAERVALSLLILVSVAAIASTTFDAAAHYYYLSIYQAPGTIYTVDNYKMHLDCTGRGSPTIILESGLGNDSLIWGNVQPRLSRTTRICSYDRAGMGWSAPRPGSRDANEIVNQLHSLLEAAGIEGPIVLMGHSLGGIYVRAYASRYPQNVVGLIFVDSSTPLQEKYGSPDVRAIFARNIPTYEYYFALLVSALGVPRVMGECTKVPAGFDERIGKMLAEDNCGISLRDVWHEYKSIGRSGYETFHTGPYGDVPTLIFSQDPQQPPESGISPKLAPELSSAWNRLQENLMRLSTRSRRIIAKGSGHRIQIDRADLLNREVPILIRQIRSKAPKPNYFGLTTTE